MLREEDIARFHARDGRDGGNSTRLRRVALFARAVGGKRAEGRKKEGNVVICISYSTLFPEEHESSARAGSRASSEYSNNPNIRI